VQHHNLGGAPPEWSAARALPAFQAFIAQGASALQAANSGLLPACPLPRPPSWASALQAQVGFNKWQLGGEKLPLAPGAVPSVEGSDFWAVTLDVPEEAFEVNMVFGDGAGLHDNNQVGPGPEHLWVAAEQATQSSIWPSEVLHLKGSQSQLEAPACMQLSCLRVSPP
jgi:hypothetical protein